MFEKFYPDYYFKSVYELTPDFFKKISARGVIFDIDNTLVPYKTRRPDKAVVAYLESLTKSGIKVAFVSNNKKERVEEFSRDTGIIFFYKSGKPSRRFVRKAMSKMELEKEFTVMVGDQLLTDILGANRAGVKSVLVDRISDNESAFIKFKRMLEIPFRRKIFYSRPIADKI